MTTGSAVFRRHPDVSFTRFGSEMLVVVPRDAWQVVLNGVAGDAYEMLDGKRSVEDVALALGDTYDAAPAQIEADLAECFADLESKGAVVRVG